MFLEMAGAPAVRTCDGEVYTFAKLTLRDMAKLQAQWREQDMESLRKDMEAAGLAPAERVKMLQEFRVESGRMTYGISQLMNNERLRESLSFSLGASVDVDRLPFTWSELVDVVYETWSWRPSLEEGGATASDPTSGSLPAAGTGSSSVP